MPRNYDEIRDAEDLSFVIRGQTFRLKRARPEDLARLIDAEEARTGEEKFSDAFAFAEERLLALIDQSNGALEAWQNIRASETDPVTFGEVMDLSNWAVTELTRLPTLRPSPSEPGPSKTAATSKAG
jgi:hypothetical protein